MSKVATDAGHRCLGTLTQPKRLELERLAVDMTDGPRHRCPAGHQPPLVCSAGSAQRPPETPGTQKICRKGGARETMPQAREETPPERLSASG